MPESLIIRGGRVVDPSANLDMVSDVLLIGDKIAEIGNLDHIRTDKKVFEASGMVVCPGFIDMHSHSDLSLLTSPLHEVKLRQGVTTEI